MNSINIAVIADRSGSVENEKIPLEDSINLLMESFKRKYLENASLRLLLITLENNDILIQEKDFKNVSFKKIELKNYDIEEILKMIEEKFKNYKGDKKIILFSDGYFNDKSNSFLNQKKESIESEIERISVGIGEGYRKIILEKFSTNGIVLEYQDIYKSLNPMYWYIEQFRDIVLHAKSPDVYSMLIGFLVAFAFLILGAWYFNKKQDEFILYI